MAKKIFQVRLYVYVHIYIYIQDSLSDTEIYILEKYV